MKKIIRRQTEDYLQGILPAPLSRILSARGIKTAEQVDMSLKRLCHFSALNGIENACELLYQSLTNNEQIVILGDFDADGATSTALAMRALTAMGFTRLAYQVPNRFAFGYGLTPEIVQLVHEQYQPQLIITVDNGIANFQGVDRAKQLGIKVLITDHHLPAETLPNADVIINPNLPNAGSMSGNLAGVGVIFYLMLALRQHLRATAWFKQNKLSEPNMAELLDLVALGTVADVVKLDDTNRILVKQGIERIRRGQCCPGIKALLAIAKRDYRQLKSSDLGFAVGPRLNAAGRLDDMTVGIECLLADDHSKANELANHLHQLNHERQAIEAVMNETAFEKILSAYREELPYGICVYEPDWHQGVIGIVASRIKERFHRPVIAFADTSDSELKGSARSIKGLHIRDVLALIDQRQPELIGKFGGHAMAAGLSLAKENFEKFNQLFNATVAELIDEQALKPEIITDGNLKVEEMSYQTARLLSEAYPWGQGFPEPAFDDEFEIVSQRPVAEKHLKLKLKKDSQVFDSIIFNVHNMDQYQHQKQIRAVYRLIANDYQGQQKLELLIDYVDFVQ